MFRISYWVLPLFSGLVWAATLVGMLAEWSVSGRPHYPWQGPNTPFPYISHTAATKWGYPLFITGSAVSVVTFNLAFISERWLRHKGRLAHNYDTSEKVLSGCAIAGAFIGGCGLIVLSVCDVVRFHTVHNSMLVVFIAGYWVSAVFICAEYQRLGVKYREYSILALSFWIKLGFVLLTLGLVAAFGGLTKEENWTAACPIEWTIAFVYVCYILSFTIDFLPAIRTRHQADRFPPPVKKAHDENAGETEKEGNMMGGPVYTSGGRNSEGEREKEKEGNSSADDVV